MIIDKTVHEWLLKCMYDKTHIKHYGQYPVGIRFHLGIVDNHEEMKMAYESDKEFYVDDYLKMKVDIKRMKERISTCRSILGLWLHSILGAATQKF